MYSTLVTVKFRLRPQYCGSSYTVSVLENSRPLGQRDSVLPWCSPPHADPAPSARKIVQAPNKALLSCKTSLVGHIRQAPDRSLGMPWHSARESCTPLPNAPDGLIAANSTLTNESNERTVHCTVNRSPCRRTYPPTRGNAFLRPPDSLQNRRGYEL